MAPAPRETGAPRYAAENRPAIRTSPRWHQYAHHIRELPAGLRRLASDLDVPPGGRILDFGCAELPYRSFFAADVDFVGADLPGNPDARMVIGADGTLPADAGAFDAVLSTQVLEHVADPALYLSEAHRVLRPGGRMLLSTHGVFVLHPDPVDLWRWTSDGLRRAVEDAGFEVVRFEGIIGLLPTGLQLVQDAIIWHLPRRLWKPFAFVMQTLMAATDRLHSAQGRANNAQVFALVAQKPG